ncbi:concentrative nucleoside transporter, CNT family [Thermotomaculum hydrothermale]|uniref:Concentrative nucleoside transporter, CNT family n=1 Tax=Thermotomaculum hydrothermale TaxID=981385 RepID=A0A7R6PZY3_9BACT|nr:nucleoside transporter C-terminal domain-containing protein [Thermotomaculum hydrothermale]BBB32953.1 concentrative nucleoside transporter, CNT family [Thermotomaculum hydrothermale]
MPDTINLTLPFFMLFIAFLLSENKKEIKIKPVVGGILLQFVFALLILKTTTGREIFQHIEIYVSKLMEFSIKGASFVFGKLANQKDKSIGFIFAFQVLPTVIFFSSIMSILYHLKIMQKVVKGMAWVMQKTMKISGAESMAVAANSFIGQTEAPLVIAPYVKDMTISELATLMVGGFATIAGSVLVAYVSFGVSAGHLVAASIMSAPAAVVIAKIIYPETEEPKTLDLKQVDIPITTSNIIEAASEGATTGMRLALNIAAMLIAFIALIALADAMLGVFGLSLKTVLGYIFYPFAIAMGVPVEDCAKFGYLLGTKVSINEFVAYLELGKMIQAKALSHRSVVLATYALCGFANFSSIAIQIGGIGGLAPERKKDLAKIGLKAMIGGALASWITACIAGILI